jgi:hypothetical protein
VEALILVSETVEVREMLGLFYGALGLPFRPGSVGDLGASVPRVVEALIEEVGGRYGAVEGRIGAETLDRARSLRKEWQVNPGPSP